VVVLSYGQKLEHELEEEIAELELFMEAIRSD